MGIVGDDADDLYTAEAIHVGAVDDGDIDVTVFGLLADVAHGGLQDGGDADVAALLAGDVLAGLACVLGGRLVSAHGREGLGGVVAGGDGVIAHTDAVLASRDVGQCDILEVRTLLGDDDELVGEHVGAG